VTRRTAHLALSAAGWLGFNAVVLWTVGFLAGEVVPRQVDGPERTTTAPAILIDVALLLLFAVQHSLMARAKVKGWLRRFVPASLERTTYVWATNLCLALMLTFWQPWGGRIWDVDGPGAVVLWALCAAGWLLAIASTFAVDHLALTGLRQAGWATPDESGPSPELKVSGLHAVVRHPLMTGLVLAFWATPHMGAAHLLFAAVFTGYVLLGVAFEERDLRRTFGSSYDDYAARVPALVPRGRSTSD
jgi:protein-S-isoprenylcysteine O-methyltransferase Ste14